MTTEADRVARDRLAREARETATTLLDWVGTRVEGTRTEPSARPRQSSGSCTWCPVCALVAALRGEQPELTATLAEQASGLLVLLRMLVAAHADGTHDHHTAPSAPAPPEEPPATWPAESGAPTGPADVPWDVAPHAVFDPAPAAPHVGAVPDDVRPTTERPTGRRGPRPSPRHTSGAPVPETPVAATATGPAVEKTGPVVGTPGPAGSRGVQRITVRRRPRPC